jgi:hypothetical protein
MQTNWCWAANAASVGNFYHGPNCYKQCEIADKCLDKNKCCKKPKSCNKYSFLDSALYHADSFEDEALSPATFSAVSQEIDANRPLCTRVKWDDKGAHFTTITGYYEDGARIVIQDPWHGVSTIEYGSYPAEYFGGGTWTNSYFTMKK